MSTIEHEDRLADAKRQDQAQFDSIKDMIDILRTAETSTRENQDAYHDVDEARERIQEDALSIEVRGGWHAPGAAREDTGPVEYKILLCTGGPACQIVGDLSEHGEPETARLQVQDWFQSWTDMRPLVGPDNYDSEPILLDYARCFYFGE